MKYFIAATLTIILSLACTNLSDLSPASGGSGNYAVAILNPSFDSTNALPLSIEGVKGSDIKSLVVMGGKTPKIAGLAGNIWSVQYLADEVYPGQNVFSVYGKDLTGKTATIAYLTIIIGDYRDITPPAVAVDYPTEGQTVDTTNIIISGTASDPAPNSTGVKEVYVAIDCLACFTLASGTTNWTCAKTLPTNNAPHGVYYYAVDNAGNYSHTNSFTFTYNQVASVDNPPTVSITAPTNGSYITSNPVNIAGTAADDNGVASVEISVNGGAYSNAAGTVSWSKPLNFANGTYYVIVRSKDTAAQYSSQKQITFTINTNAPTGYYSGINPGSTTLKADLHNLIYSHSEQTYTYLWTAFQTTDKKANGKVWDMYSDIPGGTPPYEYTFGSDQCGTYSGEGSCYNREHSWPKSWFNDLTPMYSDLFHLYPTDGYVNGKRSNYAFGEVGSTSWTSLNGSKLGICNWPGFSGTAFEPIDEYKGDFARSYFYMCVCYYGEDSGWSASDMTYHATLLPWAEAMLRTWSAQDPVSQKEIDRNDAVYAIQGNRNPFIDHPEWVQLIMDF
ncbi:MAG: hypothetical protein HPY53_13765 [Brevinematales bacterium]|nr:hypothetical protein [Brevinematales bacterium]